MEAVDPATRCVRVADRGSGERAELPPGTVAPAAHVEDEEGSDGEGDSGAEEEEDSDAEEAGDGEGGMAVGTLDWLEPPAAVRPRVALSAPRLS